MRKLLLLILAVLLVAVIVADVYSFNKHLQAQQQEDILFQQSMRCMEYLQQNPDRICD